MLARAVITLLTYVSVDAQKPHVYAGLGETLQLVLL
jgi:hypothetical protein